VTMLAAIAFGTVSRGLMISPALAAMAENPKKVMNASAAMETMPPMSVETAAVNVPTVSGGALYANAPPMNAMRTATFAPLTTTWNVPLSSVPCAFRPPSRSAASMPMAPCGIGHPCGTTNSKNHSSIVAR